MTTVVEAISASAKITFEPVALGDLHVDAAYQRPLNQAKVRKYVREFDLDRFGVPLVALRDDGTYWVIDGQHRLKAAAEALDLGADQRVRCNVYHGLTLAEEADHWYAYNVDRTNPNRHDAHRAAVAAGHEDAVAIQRILDRRHLHFGKGEAYGRVEAIGTCYELHKWHELEWALDVVKEAWGLETAAFQRDMLKAVAVLHHRHPRKVTKSRLVARLSSSSPDRLIAQARVLQAADPEDHGRTAEFLARKLVGLYNFRLTTGTKIPPWAPCLTSRKWWTGEGS